MGETAIQNKLSLNDFDYELPQELIAQYPAQRRDESRLLVVHRATGLLEHRTFADFPEFLDRGDALVINDTRVRPARLLGNKEDTGGQVEILVQRKLEPGLYQVMLRANRKVALGTRVRFTELLAGEILARNDGLRVFRFDEVGVERSLDDLIREKALLPLPPYIRRVPDEADLERYQTVYARREGAIAAPTAGLHFTEALLDTIRGKQVEVVPVTLHVGHATFQPVKSEDITEHRMPGEEGEISQDAAWYINHTRQRGGRVVAVGTTSCRLLEGVAQQIMGNERLKAEFLATQQKGRRSLQATIQAKQEALEAIELRKICKPYKGRIETYIYPPYEFLAVDSLLTNFHLPRTTLLMLVSAFAGTELVRRAYAEAVEQKYRFYSYGDAMLII
ncbi:MAG: tRNA preQ1(34) S-adenosylmethionine ribosyltransferase-isomerase QueA [Candidatus Omnitrophica bacterium]|nr:tRNA preQ1(34) S-adenosylmethionine ribosyltransferase-isomerase QueA [Candidatus Omnitrophota bacterium]